MTPELSRRIAKVMLVLRKQMSVSQVSVFIKELEEAKIFENLKPATRHLILTAEELVNRQIT